MQKTEDNSGDLKILGVVIVLTFYLLSILFYIEFIFPSDRVECKNSWVDYKNCTGVNRTTSDCVYLKPTMDCREDGSQNVVMVGLKILASPLTVFLYILKIIFSIYI
jgi:hypothetical protein